MPTTPSANVQIWFPVGFGALLCAMKMLLPSGTGDPAFYSFLPMCFLGAAQSQVSLLKRVHALETLARPTSPAAASE